MPTVKKVSASGISLTLPTGYVDDASIQPDAGVQASKLEHQYRLGGQIVAAATTVTAQTIDLAIIRAPGKSIDLWAVCTGAAPTTGDHTITVDIQRSTGGGAFASILTTPLVLDQSSVVRVPQQGAINTSTLAAGDLVRLVVTVAGSTGTQGQGLEVNYWIREDADP